MENRQKLTIAITRAKSQANEWQNSLESAGFGVFLCPLLKIIPLDSDSQNAVRQTLREFLSEKSAVVFVSPNAAHFALKLENAEFWNRHSLFAVGVATQQALAKKGLKATIPDDSEDSEGLFQTLKSQTFKKIAIVRGDHGREFLANALKEKGFEVQHFGVYQRLMCSKKTAQTLLNKALANEIDGILITSSESLAAWLNVLKLPRLPAALVKFPLFVIHSRIAKTAEKLGFAHVLEVKNDKALKDFLTREGFKMAKKTKTQTQPEIIEGEATPVIETADNNHRSAEYLDESTGIEAQAESPASQEIAPEITTNNKTTESPKSTQSAESPNPMESQQVPTAPVKEKSTKKSGSTSLLMWLLMWVLLAAVAWTAWYSKSGTDRLAQTSKASEEQHTAQMQELSAQVAKDFGSRDSRLAALEDHQKEWQAQIQAAVSAEIDAKVAKAEEAIKTAQANLKAESERLQQLQAGAPLIGVFQRVMAAQQALATNPEWAATLLQSTLVRLKAQTDAQSANLLPLVEDDLAALSRDAHLPNVAAMVKTIDEIAKTSASWPLKKKAAEKQLNAQVQKAQENPPAEAFSWASVGAWLADASTHFWTAISDFVRVQSATPEDMMAETAPAWMLYENMRQRLMTLKLSLAALNEPVFLAEVADTLKAIERDFDVMDDNVVGAQKSLKEMQNARFGRPATLKSATFLMAVPAEILP